MAGLTKGLSIQLKMFHFDAENVWGTVCWETKG